MNFEKTKRLAVICIKAFIVIVILAIAAEILAFICGAPRGTYIIIAAVSFVLVAGVSIYMTSLLRPYYKKKKITEFKN